MKPDPVAGGADITPEAEAWTRLFLDYFGGLVITDAEFSEIATFFQDAIDEAKGEC